jgi:CPA1 family monovalent cation:H+ antiporter
MDLPAAEAAIARAKLAAAEAHAYDGDGKLIHPQLLDSYRKRAEATDRYAEDADNFMAGIRSHFDVMQIAIAAGRAELIRLHRDRQIEVEVLHNLERDLDFE